MSKSEIILRIGTTNDIEASGLNIQKIRGVSLCLFIKIIWKMKKTNR